MVRALLDTNVLIDYLNAIPEAVDELRQWSQPTISIVTWIEVMVGADTESETHIRDFLSRFQVRPVEGEIAERAARLRRLHRMKLPDAIIWATAQVHGLLLITRNTKDFPANDPNVRVPYRL